MLISLPRCWLCAMLHLIECRRNHIYHTSELASAGITSQVIINVFMSLLSSQTYGQSWTEPSGYLAEMYGCSSLISSHISCFNLSVPTSPKCNMWKRVMYDHDGDDDDVNCHLLRTHMCIYKIPSCSKVNLSSYVKSASYSLAGSRHFLKKGWRKASSTLILFSGLNIKHLPIMSTKSLFSLYPPSDGNISVTDLCFLLGNSLMYFFT